MEASSATINIFVTTHEDHMHQSLNDQWNLTSVQNIESGSFSCYLKYITLCGDQVVNLNDFHDDISITISIATNKNIEFIPSFLYLDISSPLNVLIFQPIYHSIHSSYLHKYISFWRIIHSIITNGVSVKSYLDPIIQCIFGHNYSVTHIWE